MPDGSILNRYWDVRGRPRDESYREDVVLAARTGRPRARALPRHPRRRRERLGLQLPLVRRRARLATIDTTEHHPGRSQQPAVRARARHPRGCERQADATAPAEFARRAPPRGMQRSTVICGTASARLLDYVDLAAPVRAVSPLRPCSTRCSSGRPFGAGGRRRRRAPPEVARAGRARDHPVDTGQQWDAPNGWAPLQWVAVEGLSAYGQAALARPSPCAGWRMSTGLRASGKLVEKYNVHDRPRRRRRRISAAGRVRLDQRRHRALMQLYPRRPKAPPVQTVSQPR